MKKLLRLIGCTLLLAAATFALSSCGKKASLAERVARGEKISIGIIQYMSHPSLDNCREGILESLNASGIDCTIDVRVGSASSADADCASYAMNFVADGVDLLIAIATPAAQSAFAATADTDIPLIFCAVSDPVAAKLVDSLERPGDLASGTSDVLDLEAQLDLIRAFQPDVQKIGVLYTASEANSLTNLASFRTLCERAGITLVARSVSSQADIPAAATTLAGEVDCINNFTDNTVVSALSVVLNAADANRIPVYGSEVEQVKNGCLASVSIDYVALGRTTGDMAVDAMRGASVRTMPVRTITDATPLVNLDVLRKLNLSIPAKYASIETVGGDAE